MRMPEDLCDLRRVVAWLTDNQTAAHLATENFYRNTTNKCIEIDASGVTRTVGNNEPVQIVFT